MSARRLALIPVVAALASAAVFAAMPGGRVERAFACGPAGPYDFDTYESFTYLHDYARLIESAAYGRAVSAPYAEPPPAPATPPAIVEPSPVIATASETPVATETAEPSATSDASTGTPEETETETETASGTQSGGVDFTFQGMETGSRDSRTSADRSMVIPPSILKSIVWIEANWANASADTPWGGVGPILRSFDCGYGLGQITTGMRNENGTPAERQALIGTHPAFNLAEGARILADKWNSAPEFRPIAGTGNPFALEDWYYAIWSYNGFAETNHPLNPFRDPLRGEVYHCWNDGAPHVDSGFGYGDYTYPERVYGCMRYPPSKFVGDQEVQVWSPVTFNMPFFEDETVAEAFALTHFQSCSSSGFRDGCVSMDYPTTLPAVHYEDGSEPDRPAVLVHYDPTPVDPGLPTFARSGDSLLVFTGTSAASVDLLADGPDRSAASVSVRNLGSGIGSYRVVSSVPWLYVVNAVEPWHDDGPRTLDGGIAIGSNLAVLTQVVPEEFSTGYGPELRVMADTSRHPGGTQTGTVTFEPLTGGAQAFTVTVTATSTEPDPGGAGGAGLPYPFRAIVPGATSDGE